MENSFGPKLRLKPGKLTATYYPSNDTLLL